ncbi:MULTISPECIES: hypothetical protein [unclassified Nocardioides]|uniref:hypothetical protein n=1 Tax=unclassified Nocardioides TaxID=2615069 RepID=UPI0009EFC769|nr:MULTISPECIES: hypothetical protein [unclassified Nocardioides]GAW48024.1 uncharacterized protein PD653B2_0335 [Nocardioides sp. PD653-B2]GAW53673.1 uncharacterized protein PD653_1076 [Nocardioides sp. PD653]
MLVEAISEVATQLVVAGSIKAEGVGNVCAQAPTGVKPYVNDILGWVKYGVIAIIIGAGFASSGALIVGKFGQMGRAAQIGASGLFWTVIGAVAFVTIYAILNGIVGDGC